MVKVVLVLSLLLVACGKQGKVGKQGNSGKDGSSCSVQTISNGAIIMCTDGTSSVILNGADAEPAAYNIVELVNPCGDAFGFDEVLLRTSNNSLLAHYSQGNKQFLSLLTPGNYMTTDGTNCYFTISNDLTVTW